MAKKKQTKKIDRRGFIKLAALTGIAAMVPTTFYILERSSNDVDDYWSFIKEPRKHNGNKNVPHFESIVRKYAPLGKEMPIADGTAEFENIKKTITPVLQEELQTMHPDGANYGLSAASQNYGIPTDPSIAASLVDYCQTAERFLHDSLSGLDDFSIDWLALKEGERRTNQFNQKAVIGRGSYEVVTVTATNKENPDQKLVKGRVSYIDGSYNRGSYDFDTRTHKWWVIFIGTGPAAINAPFSELIPLTTTKKRQEYAREAGMDIAIQADEALAEGISYTLSMMISDELQIPQGIQTIQDADRNIIESYKDKAYSPYKYVDHSKRWIKKNGIQRAFDLYMESPQKFMDQIKNS